MSISKNASVHCHTQESPFRQKFPLLWIELSNNSKVNPLIINIGCANKLQIAVLFIGAHQTGCTLSQHKHNCS